MGCPYQTSDSQCTAIEGAKHHCPNMDMGCPYVNELLDKIKELEKSRQSTQEWYAQRWETLKDWARDHGHTEVFSILANGISTPQDPPTYAQQMNTLKHKLEAAEKWIKRACGEWSTALGYLRYRDLAPMLAEYHSKLIQEGQHLLKEMKDE